MAGPTVILRPRDNTDFAVTLEGDGPINVVVAPIDPEDPRQQWTVEDVPGGGKAFRNRSVYDRTQPEDRWYLAGRGVDSPVGVMPRVEKSAIWNIGKDFGDGFNDIWNSAYPSSLNHYDSPDFRVMLRHSDSSPRFQWKLDDANAIAGRLVSSIVAVRTPDGTANVFGIGLDDGALYQINQSVPGGGPWSYWVKVPGYAYCKQIAAAVIGDGRIEVAAVGSDDFVYVIAQDTLKGQWRPWVRLGTQLCRQVLLARNRNAGLTAIGIGRDDSIAYFANQIDSKADTWTPWAPVDPDVPMQQMSVIRNSQDVLELYGISAAGRAVHTIQGSLAVAAPPTPWQKWQEFDTNTTVAAAAASNAPGDPRVGALVRTNKTLFVAMRSGPSQPWSGWSALPHYGLLEPQAGTLVSNLDGRFLAVGVDTLHDFPALWSAQTQPGGSEWSPWAPVGLGGFKQVAADMNPGGRLEVYAIGLNDALYVSYQRDPGTDFAGWWWLGPGGR
jgi:hypothetical protein